MQGLLQSRDLLSRVPMEEVQDGGCERNQVRQADFCGPQCHLYNAQGVYSQMGDKKVDSTEERKYISTAPATKKFKMYSLRRTWLASTEWRTYKLIVGLVAWC